MDVMIQMADVAPDNVDRPVDQAGKDEPKNSSRRLVYGVDEKPPVCLTLLLSVQNAVTTVGGLLIVANILAPKLCILPEDPARAYLLSTAVMMAGISTLFQAVVGVRLPIIQTSGFVYMMCTLSLLNLPKWKCDTVGDLFSMGPLARTAKWETRVRDTQGAIIVISVFQMLLGYSGFVGKVLKYITPLTVVPTMIIIGLSVIEKGMLLMSGNWTTSIATLFFLTLFSQYLRKIAIPLPMLSTAKGLIRIRLKIFALLSILLSVGIMWIACIYMTSKNSLRPTDPANTDSKSGVFHNADVFRLPYPFQWGVPTFNFTSIMSMVPALFISIIESVGNYNTCAKFADLTKPPPRYAVNRGIGMQGICSILAGVLGTGSGVSSSGENVGNLGITQVYSKVVIIFAACIMIFTAPFTKFIALFITLPDPVLGAVMAILLVLISAVALANLQFINLNSIRNMYILGMSMFFGLALPKYVTTHDRLVNTKYESLNDILFMYMSSEMFMGGLIGFILDNTIPDDNDNMLSSKPYHRTANDEAESPIEIEEDKTYKIPDGIYEKINGFLTIFM